MKLLSWVRLTGPSVDVLEAPKVCPNCGAKEFYQQTDFKRSLGLAMVVIFSLSTFVLMYLGFNWFLVWSPMLAALVIDRTFAYTNPLTVICYKCGLLFRGLEKHSVYKTFEAFDLEKYDRIHYPDHTA